MADLIEVRCCCQPRKLLGWLPRPEFLIEGMSERFPLGYSMHFLNDESLAVSLDSISLPVAKIVMENGSSHIALKAEGYDVETLRKVRGFIENRR